MTELAMLPRPTTEETPMQRLGRILSTLLLAAAATACAQTPMKPKLAEIGGDPTSAIWIGNSFFYYNTSMHGHVGNFIAAGMPGFRHRGTSVTISGSGFDWHDVNSYFRPNAVGGYSFAAQNIVNFYTLYKLIYLVIMMDCSQCPLHPQLKQVFHD